MLAKTVVKGLLIWHQNITQTFASYCISCLKFSVKTLKMNIVHSMFLTTKLLFHGIIIREDWWAKCVWPVNMKYDVKQIHKRLWFIILYRLMCRNVNFKHLEQFYYKLNYCLFYPRSEGFILTC